MLSHIDSNLLQNNCNWNSNWTSSSERPRDACSTSNRRF